MSVGELLEDSLDVCDSSPSDSFTRIQFLFRAYLMPITYLFGIFSNSVNVIVFTQKTVCPADLFTAIQSCCKESHISVASKKATGASVAVSFSVLLESR